MSVVSIVAETEIVTALQAREWCRADSSDDTYLAALIPAARDIAETFTGRALVAKTLIDRRDCFPSGRVIELEQPPLRTVVSVKYIDSNGEEQTLSDSLYSEDIYSAPGRIILNDSESWPTTKSVPNAVKITYTAGYTSAAKVDDEPSYALPALLRDGMRFFIAHLFSYREPITEKTRAGEIPENLLPFFMPYKVNW